MKKRLCSLVFTIALLFGFANVFPAYAGSTKPIIWNFQDTYNASSWPCKYLNKPLIKWIEKATSGRIKIIWHPPGALASVYNTYDALSRGVFQVAAMYPGFYVGIAPEYKIEQGLPWAWTDAKSQVMSLFKFGLFKQMSKIYEKHGIKLLADYPMGDVYSIGTVKPVTKLSELKGMKIRAVGIYADYVRALGADPVSTPYGEMYMALKMGTIDGFLASSGSLVSNKMGEVVKNFLLPTTNSIGFVIGVNKQAWDALPQDLKNILANSAPLAAVGIAAQYSGIVEASEDTAKKMYGVKFHMLSQKDQQEARKLSIPIWNEVAKQSPGCKEAVESVKKTLKYLGRM